MGMSPRVKPINKDLTTAALLNRGWTWGVTEELKSRGGGTEDENR